MKRFFVLLFLLALGLPSFAYINDFLAEKYIVWHSKETRLFEPFINSNTDKIVATYCDEENECLNTVFYKIDDTFASTQRGSIVNYRKGEFQHTRLLNLL